MCEQLSEMVTPIPRQRCYSNDGATPGSYLDNGDNHDHVSTATLTLVLHEIYNKEEDITAPCVSAGTRCRAQHISLTTTLTIVQHNPTPSPKRNVHVTWSQIQSPLGVPISGSISLCAPSIVAPVPVLRI